MENLREDSSGLEWQGEESESEDEITKSKLASDYSIGDFVLVNVKGEKTEQKFAAKIIQRDNAGADVTFLRNFRKHVDIFVFPEVEDKSYVLCNEILGQFTSVGTMRRGQIVLK